MKSKNFLLHACTIIYYLIFNKDKLSVYFEGLDDLLTNKCSREEREKVVRKVNWLLDRWVFRETIQFFLNRAKDIEPIDLDVEAFHARKHRELPKGETRLQWKNWVAYAQAEPLLFKVPGRTNGHIDVVKNADQLRSYDFETLKELQKIVKEAESRQLKVRCVASGHALGDVALSNDIMISSKKFTAPQRLANDYLKPEYTSEYEATIEINGKPHKEKRRLFETGAGTLVADLNAILEMNGLALINQGGSDVQGLFGGVSTSTHGSGIHIGPYPAFVKSFVLVGEEGKIYRIEPSDGITDPASFKNSADHKEYGIELIQDDKVFNTAIVSMGSMGLVYSCIIEVRDAYFLYEERRLKDWDELKSEMQQMGIEQYAAQHRHFEFSVNPYRVNEEGKPDPSGQRKCLIMTRDIPKENLEIPTDEKGQKFQRNFFSSFLAGISVAGTISAWLFNRNPQNCPGLINNSLLRLVDHAEDGGGFYNKSYRVLNQGLRELKFFGYAIEIAFPLEQLFEVLERMFELAEEAAKDHQYHPAPLAVRFVEECPAYLSMMNGGKRVTIEVVTVKGMTGGMDLLQRVEREMKRFDGRPHWGLFTSHLDGERLKKCYPDTYDQWKKTYAHYCVKDTFTNDFTYRMDFHN